MQREVAAYKMDKQSKTVVA